MEIWEGKVAVVTGASSGIGAQIVCDLAKAGLHVVGLARRKNRIEDLAEQSEGLSGKIYALQCDLTSVESIRKAFTWIKEQFGKVHILINNAGRGKNATMLESNVLHEDYLATINLNISGVVVCTREAYRLMESHNEPGYIINVNSVAGHATAKMETIVSNIYAATKHAVTNLTDHLRLELAVAGNKRIRITVSLFLQHQLRARNKGTNCLFNKILIEIFFQSLSPGVVKTEFMSTAGYEVNNFVGFEHLEPKDISDAVRYILSLPAHVNVTEMTIRPTGEKF